MFLSRPKWPILCWNIFSVNSVDLNYKKWQVIYSILLLITCILNIYITPKVVCILEETCDTSLSGVIKGTFAWVVAITCLISRLTIVFKSKNQLLLYKKNMDNLHKITPITYSEMNKLKTISYQVVILSMLIIVPTNLLRLWFLAIRGDFTVYFFFCMYVQNISMCFIETHFIFLCFILYQKFVTINKDLTSLKIDTIMRNKYPFLSQIREKYDKNYNIDDYNKEVLNSLAEGHPMIIYIEKLKLKYRLTREASKNLNDLFGIHLGLSMCSLCLYAMFDLYYHIAGLMDPSKSQILIYGWILQYSFRFGSVTILAHLTTKQVINYFVKIHIYFLF